MAAAPPELCRVSFVVGDAETDRRAVMRAWTIPILGAVAFSLAAPPIADARPRFGPAMLLGAMAAPLGMFAAGSRHSVRYYRRGTTRPSNDQGVEGNARADRRAAPGALSTASAPVFWPDASTDLVDYLIFPRGKDDQIGRASCRERVSK